MWYRTKHKTTIYSTKYTAHTIHTKMVTTKCTAPLMAAAAAIVVCLLASGVSAQSPAAAPGGNDCFTALANVSDCLTYVEKGSKQKKPDKACCPELAGLVNSNPICLCQLFAKPDFAGVKLDLNKALKLPSVCGVTTPPVSTCSAVGVPVSLPPSSEYSTSPSGQPAKAPPTSPLGPVAPPAGAPGPVGGSDCFTALANMSDCLTFVEAGSKKKKPDKACCPELAGLVDSNPICLCQLLAKPDFAGIKVDLNKALKLPSVCGVTTPPVSTCSAVGVPVSLPPSSEYSTSPSGQPAKAPSTSSSGVGARPAASSRDESTTSPSQVAAATPSGNGAIISSKPSGLPFIIGLTSALVSIFF